MKKNITPAEYGTLLWNLCQSSSKIYFHAIAKKIDARLREQGVQYSKADYEFASELVVLHIWIVNSALSEKGNIKIKQALDQIKVLYLEEARQSASEGVGAAIQLEYSNSLFSARSAEYVKLWDAYDKGDKLSLANNILFHLLQTYEPDCTDIQFDDTIAVSIAQLILLFRRNVIEFHAKYDII